MSINDPQYPTTVYDGLSPRRVAREDNASPEFEDWDQHTAALVIVWLLVFGQKITEDKKPNNYKSYGMLSQASSSQNISLPN